MKKPKYSLILILLSAVIFGCSDNSINNAAQTETLIFQLDGIIENLGGDCSAVQVRTRSLGEFDFTNINKIKFNFNGMSDADLSSIRIYYMENDEQINLVDLPNRDVINSTQNVILDTPVQQCELFVRVTLQSSVCTGQIFYLTFSDLKIYSIQ